MPGIHLRNPGFTHSVCGPFTKNKKRIQKFKEIEGSEETKRELKLALNMTWFIETANKLSHDETFKIAKKTKYDGYQRVHASIV